MPRPWRKPDPNDPKAQCGARLRCARLALGWPEIGPFAARFGVEANAWGAWERGERTPDPLTMAKLWDKTGITLEWIFAGSLRGMDGDVQDALERLAAEHGAVVGGTVARWPMQDDHRAVPPARAPTLRRPSQRRLHEGQEGLPDN